MNKVLVSYFSASGVTKKVAEGISGVLNADIFEIEPVDRYTDEDLDWTNNNSRSSIEMQNRSYRPPIKNKVSNITLYDTVIIGFPVWWDVAPTVVNTFIEENDLTNKKIYIFVTSGSSSEFNSFKDLKEKYTNLNFVSAKRFNTNINRDEILNWID